MTNSFDFENINHYRSGIVALDLDGTVVDEEGLMDVTISIAIKKLIIQKYRIAICTARSFESATSVLEGHFSEIELKHFDFVTGNGSSVCVAVLGKGSEHRRLRDIRLDTDLIIKQPWFMKLTTTIPAERISIKDTAVLVRFDDYEEVRRHVFNLQSVIIDTVFRAYIYGCVVVFSLQIIDKDDGLRLLLTHHSIPYGRVLRIADQGGQFEADYTFLRDRGGITVGTQDIHNSQGCQLVIDQSGSVLRGLSATGFVLNHLASD